MRSVLGFMMLLSCSTIQAAKPVAGTGFVCTAADSRVIRLNIDLKKKTWDKGEGRKALDSINDTTVTLEGPNPFLLPKNIYHSLALNRTSLVLTERMVAPHYENNWTVDYNCVQGPVIDFTKGRQF